MSKRPRLAVSSCLLGERVRYDGKEKRVAWLAELSSAQVEIVPICPEVGAGMPVPRPPIQIALDQGVLRLRVVDEGTDCTDQVDEFVQRQLQVLEAQPIDGYLFKSRSPSCGLRDTPYFSSALKSPALGMGSGVWAAKVAASFATIPLADENQLVEEDAQQAFLEQVRAHWVRRSV